MFAQEVVMGLGAFTDTSAEVTMDTPFDVGGFQFNAVGANVTAGTGGLAADAGFQVSTGGETILGFSFTGSVIPAGSSGVLTNLAGTFPTDLCLSLGSGAISDGTGGALDHTFGESDCDYTVPCDEDADNDGICDDVDDCVGEYDECGVCNGDGSSCNTEPMIGFGAWDSENMMLDVDVVVGDADLAGFQFGVTGISIAAATGGLAEDNGFTVSTSASVVIGFSLTGDVIPAGTTGVLTTLMLSSVDELEGCMVDVVLSDSDGNGMNWMIGDCVVVGEVVEGCTDDTACNYDMDANTDDGSCTYPEENYDCDGNCAIEEDCTGECGGDAIVDECGVCEGDNTSCLNVVYFGAVTESDTGNSMEIWLSAVTDVAGFQFDVTGVSVNDASGGVEDIGWTVSFNETGTVIGFDLAGTTLAEGEHLLTVLDFGVADFEGCITFENDGALADANGDTLPSATGECVTFTSAVGGCTDDMACNYNMDANVDDGSCTYPEENYDCDGNFIATNVQIIHNSASPTVDVYVNDALAIENFEYRTATPVLVLPTSFTVGIAPADGDVIASFDIELDAGGSYAVVATGLLGNDETPFGLAATATTFGASSNDVVGLEVYHGSTDAPAVDVYANDAMLLENFAYGDFSGFVEVPAADYTLGLAPTGGDLIAAFAAPLSGLGGGSAVVFASGFLSGDDPAFGLFAALADGTVLELPGLTQDCSGEWGGDDYIVCDDGSLVCDEADCPVAAAVSLGFGEVTDSSIEVIYDTNADIAGFQFTVSGLTLSDASGGAAEEAGFTVSVGATTGIVIGFSFDGSVIPAGAGTLTTLSAYNPSGNTEACMSDAIISDSNGGSFENVTVGECADISMLDISDELPGEYSLSQNYPNPFNPTTNISFSIVEASDVSLKVYDLSGKEINELANNFYTPGTYNVMWDATDSYGNQVSSGIYMYQLKSKDGILSNSMILMR
tara:strand:+ start:28 stop:2895 length:2868 start_codon:yes stop_codon:yes gene_type:complete